MVFLQRTLRWELAVLLAAVFVLPGCPLSPDKDDGGPVETVAPERNSVDGAVDLFEYVWINERHDLYVQLLADDFEFFPLDDDAQDFQWLSGDSWGRTIELTIAQNMFNDAFEGEDVTSPVDRIEMTLEGRSYRDLPEPAGAVEVTCTVNSLVWLKSGNGLSTDARFTFEVVLDPDEPGLYQIAEQRELSPTG